MSHLRSLNCILTWLFGSCTLIQCFPTPFSTFPLWFSAFCTFSLRFSHSYPNSLHSHIHSHPESLHSLHSNPNSHSHSSNSVLWFLIPALTDSHFVLLIQNDLLILKNWIREMDRKCLYCKTVRYIPRSSDLSKKNFVKKYLFIKTKIASQNISASQKYML